MTIENIIEGVKTKASNFVDSIRRAKYIIMIPALVATGAAGVYSLSGCGGPVLTEGNPPTDTINAPSPLGQITGDGIHVIFTPDDAETQNLEYTLSLYRTDTEPDQKILVDQRTVLRGTLQDINLGPLEIGEYELSLVIHDSDSNYPASARYVFSVGSKLIVPQDLVLHRTIIECLDGTWGPEYPLP